MAVVDNRGGSPAPIERGSSRERVGSNQVQPIVAVMAGQRPNDLTYLFEEGCQSKTPDTHIVKDAILLALVRARKHNITGIARITADCSECKSILLLPITLLPICPSRTPHSLGQGVQQEPGKEAQTRYFRCNQFVRLYTEPCIGLTITLSRFVTRRKGCHSTTTLASADSTPSKDTSRWYPLSHRRNTPPNIWFDQ